MVIALRVGFCISDSLKQKKLSHRQTSFFRASLGDRLRDQGNPKFFKIDCRL